MSAKNIDLLGVTNSAPDNLAKQTTFLFEFEDHSCFGIVGFTGAYWSVGILGGEMVSKTKDALRKKIARSSPQDYCVIADPIVYFYNKNFSFNSASEKQQAYLKKLFPQHPQELLAPYLEEMLSTINFYHNVIVKRDYHVQFLETDCSELIRRIEEFKQHDYTQKNQFEFMEKFRSIYGQANKIYEKGRELMKGKSLKELSKMKPI